MLAPAESPPFRRKPFIVGIGGTTRENSSSERAMRLALQAAEVCGAETLVIPAYELGLPVYIPDQSERTPQAARLIEAIRQSDGIIIASPGYHGCLSGLLKNALDYIEDLRDDPRTYFQGRAVGCIATSSGWQAAVSTLHALRTIVHSLRGWPTPLGVAINTSETTFGIDGTCSSDGVQAKLQGMTQEVIDFAQARIAVAASRSVHRDQRSADTSDEV